MDSTTRRLDLILKAPFPSYHKPLAMARSLSRSGVERDRLDAIELLEGLGRRYPHAVVFGQELVLALIEAGRHDEADLALRGFERESPSLDEEFICRWGRLFKERGDEHSRPSPAAPGGAAPDPALAEELYRKSLEKYDRAFQIRSGHYPGINKATLLLLLGSLAPAPAGAPPRPELVESAELAGRLLAGRSRWPREQPDDETVWHPATAGEAHLLRKEWGEAAGQYREALRRKGITPHARESMRRQAERILRAFAALGIQAPPPFDEPASLFGIETTGQPAPTGPDDPAPKP